VLVQDARFQQLYEQYQGTVLQAAREVDDAAVGFVANRAQVPLLAESVKAAQRSLDIATIQYREGMAGFERVLDSQRALFSQQERLVNNLGNVAQSLIAAVQGDGRRLAAGARAGRWWTTRRARRWRERSDWRDLLIGAVAAARCRPATDFSGEGRTMTEESPSQNPSTATGDEAPQPGKATRIGRRSSCWP
jgi:multidrug efflux system outer membrane protein